jgi:hypothetical protein
MKRGGYLRELTRDTQGSNFSWIELGFSLRPQDSSVTIASTEGIFTYVAVDTDRRSRPVPPES